MLPIVTLPTLTLRDRSREITRAELLSTKTKKLIKDMIPTMYGDDGIGLAAPQVGENLRICVVGKDALPKLTIDNKHLTVDLVLVNPVWTKINKKTAWDTEGCLSVPGIFGEVKRYTNIEVTAWNELGEEIKFMAQDFFARVIQHEVDHLDGILFIDKAKNLYKLDKKASRL